MIAEPPTGGVIYGVRLRSEDVYRYVGLTTKTAPVRLRQHFKVAAAGRKTPFYDWLRKQDRDNVIAVPLDWADGLDELGEAEIAWIVLLRQEGHCFAGHLGVGISPKGKKPSCVSDIHAGSQVDWPVVARKSRKCV